MRVDPYPLGFHWPLYPQALAAFLIAFGIVLLLGPRTIAFLRVLKFGQNINEDAPQRHQQKQGTPTMGGLLLVLSLLLTLGIGIIAVPSLRPLSAPLLAVVLVFIGPCRTGLSGRFSQGPSGQVAWPEGAAEAGRAGGHCACCLWSGWPGPRRRPFTTTVLVWRQSQR